MSSSSSSSGHLWSLRACAALLLLDDITPPCLCRSSMANNAVSLSLAYRYSLARRPPCTHPHSQQLSKAAVDFSPGAIPSLVVIETQRSWSRDRSRPKFCGLGLGLEALVSAVSIFISNATLNCECWYINLMRVFKS